jgi:hypothetical protein
MSKNQIKQGVCHTTALPLTLKGILKAKEKLQKLKYFTTQKYIIFKKTSKRIQNRSRSYNSIANLKLQHKPKISSFEKSSCKNRPIIT